MSLAELFHAYANPDAVMSAPVSQMAGTGSTKLQAMKDLERRLATGAEGLTGEAKYAALRANAEKLRELQGAPDMAPIPNTTPPDLSLMREIMDRLTAARAQRWTMKD
jgi:hypothetical protein